MKCVLPAWGELKRGFQMMAPAGMCFQGMEANDKGILRCWQCVKCVLRALVELKRGFQVLAPGEMCFACIGAVQEGVSDVGAG